MSALIELATEELRLTPENGGVVGDWMLCGRRVLLREFYGVRGRGSGLARVGKVRCWSWKRVGEFNTRGGNGGVKDECGECEGAFLDFRQHGIVGAESALRHMYFKLKRNRVATRVSVFVTLEEFIANWYRDSPACPECKRPILLSATERRWRPSYDRIDSSVRDYVSGNNQFLHLSCNCRKGNRTMEREAA